MNKPNNPPAFPRSGFEVDVRTSMSSDTTPQEGMTLRDYFAIHADEEDFKWFLKSVSDGLSGICNRSEARYKFADSMLKSREVSND